MAIYTPRGLKIRLEVPYAFALMARLSPTVRPFRVLKTTEALEHLPGLLAFIAAIVAFITRLSPLEIGFAVGGARVIGVLFNMFGLYPVPGLVSMGTLFSYVSGFGLFYGIAVIVGFSSTGWRGVLAFLVGHLVAQAIAMSLEFWQAKRFYRLLGFPLTSSEVHFFNAYRLHASRVGVTTDIDLTDEELEKDRWGPTFSTFAVEWPEVVQRFTA